jgi:hypothetical protein
MLHTVEIFILGLVVGVFGGALLWGKRDWILDSIKKKVG